MSIQCIPGEVSGLRRFGCMVILTKELLRNGNNHIIIGTTKVAYVFKKHEQCT